MAIRNHLRTTNSTLLIFPDFPTPQDKRLETCSLVHADLVVRLTPKMMRAHAKFECVVTRTRMVRRTRR